MATVAVLKQRMATQCKIANFRTPRIVVFLTSKLLYLVLFAKQFSSTWIIFPPTNCGKHGKNLWTTQKHLQVAANSLEMFSSKKSPWSEWGILRWKSGKSRCFAADFATHPSISRRCWFPKHPLFWLPVGPPTAKVTSLSHLKVHLERDHSNLLKLLSEYPKNNGIYTKCKLISRYGH